ncbi:MAG TPA: SufD family Fe-S cluster assembly protein [Spirochaetota bacterium]|nr:SufD family Fe-S cluster assembly protein [Spirochaetota bacterium]
MSDDTVKQELYSSIGQDPHTFDNPEIAHVTINENKVLASNTVPGLTVDVRELPDGIDLRMELEENRVIQYPVHMCFGVIPRTGVQRINLDVVIGKNSKISLMAHCSFPFAVDVKHIMDAKIKVMDGAEYSYFERHVHSETGGVNVLPKAVVDVGRGARFRTEFQLLKGRVGIMDIDYETHVAEEGLVEMTALVSGSGDDHIVLHETAFLEGASSRAVLTSKVAVRNNARSEVFNKIVALAPYARGHVDCKEIIKDNGVAVATPIVDVRDAHAHVTHEAAIGSVDKKQLETLMSRGMDEDEASEVIIQGLLS